MSILPVFLIFWATIDPIGTIPVFIASTNGFSDKAKRAVAYRAILVASLVLLGFIAVGEFVLNGLGISLDAFQIAGGIVLFLFALSMIFGEGKPSAEEKMIDENLDVAVFPLAIPSLASPGAMLMAVLYTQNNQMPPLEQLVTAVIMLSVLLVSLGFMLVAGKIGKFLGNGGVSIVSRVDGMILASVAVGNILEGITDYFGL
ncbi:MAG: MarC family protein [Synechococcaceae cyanobacterium SM2_3_60]|nr:MarC family protein [Synechococcaceae cyanobacterium SM2_3_60]